MTGRLRVRVSNCGVTGTVTPLGGDLDLPRFSSDGPATDYEVVINAF